MNHHISPKKHAMIRQLHDWIVANCKPHQISDDDDFVVLTTLVNKQVNDTYILSDAEQDAVRCAYISIIEHSRQAIMTHMDALDTIACILTLDRETCEYYAECSGGWQHPWHLERNID